MASTRSPAAAGSFYPASYSQLKEQVEKLLEEAPQFSFKERVLGVIVPHAGYTYSGKVAATAHKILKDKAIKTVIILGPSHFVGFTGISVYPSGFWETPLGKVPIDKEMVEKIKNNSSYFIDSPELQKDEHSLEVQLPFLQIVLKDFEIVPLMFGDITESMLRETGEILKNILKAREDVVVVASTDLYHGYSYKSCVETDHKTIDIIRDGDPDKFFQALRNGEAQACGGYGVAILLDAVRGFNPKVELLFYTNSADVMGSQGGYVVGYSALALIEERDNDLPEFKEEEKKELLKIARASVEYALKGKSYLPDEPSFPSLKVKTGIFVTLKDREDLRGCVGYILGIKPLYLLAADAAKAAAFNDPRFPPLTEREFSSLSFEISILSSPQPINSPNDIRIGRDGLMVRRGPYQGLLLPQVATENNWDRIAFLNHTCLKAGLPMDCWKDEETTVFKFSAVVFGEEVN